MTTGAGEPKATRREWIGLGVIALPCLLYSMDLTVLNLALPELSASLLPSASELLWIVDIYGFLVAGLLITMGTLGDRIGRRRLLMFGASAFGVASVLAAFSTSATMLIAMRAVLGVAGATLAPSTLSLIRNMFLAAGLATAPWAGGFILGSMAAPMIVRRAPPAAVLAAGLALAASGFGLLTLVNTASSLTVLVSASVAISLGLAPVFTLATDLIVGAARPDRAGAAAALSETSSELGGALGIALLGSVGVSLYGRSVLDALPHGISAEAAETARSTLGAALSLAGRLTEPVGAELSSLAREAFTQAFRVTSGISAMMLSAMAVFVLVQLAAPGSNTSLAEVDDAG